MSPLQRNLTWFAFVILTFLAIGVSGYFGFFDYLKARDFTYLSFGIITVYSIASLLLFRKTRSSYIQSDDLDGYHFLAELFLGVGLVGTVIGLLYVFTAFDNVPNNIAIEQLKPFMVAVGSGSATALLTTLVGLVASYFMRTQLWILERL
jgi:hypothetical protein